ncbi:MAG TPA: murein biosynthesis integral membrane protein MurJ, partial [Chloroflexi bacterium]|nr:murein biosynthesis integral membrane protein MurJ [Chloroflexota bacterium]
MLRISPMENKEKCHFPARALPPQKSDADLGIARAAGILALGNVTSRVMGLGREMIIAHFFGATGLVSAFRVASIIPTMIYELLIGGMLSAALVPVLSEYAASERREELGRVVGVVLTTFGLALGITVLLIEFLAPYAAWLLGGGFTPELREVTTLLIRLVIPAVLIFGSSGIITGLLYSLKRFTAPAFGAAVYNLGIILAAPLLAEYLGIRSLAVGVLLGASLQLLIQLPSLKDISIRPSLNLSHPALRRIFLLYLPIAAGLVISQVQITIDRNLASRTGPSSIAWMANATTLIQFPHGLIAVAISTAILPSLSAYAAAMSNPGHEEEFISTLALGIRMVLTAVLPATVGLFVLSYPIVALIFEHGRFTSYDTTWTVLALRLYLIGLVFASVDWPLNYAFYARKDTLTPALVGVLSVLVYLAAALTLIGPLGMAGLVLADSIKHISHATTMLVLF